MIRKIFCLALLLATFLAACQRTTATITPTPPATNADAIRTAAAQTADARLEAIPSPTPIPPTPDAALTQTADAQTSPTVTPLPDPAQPTEATLTPTIAASATQPPQSSGADKASFVKDVTIPDNTVISPGAKFTKTWQFLNSGTSNWSKSYELVWVDGNQMGATTSVKIPLDVPARQTVDISVELTAPTTNGTYKGFWRMRNPAGQYFGDAVYVQIKVGEGAATPGPAASVVTNLVTVVDNANVSAACPHQFVISTSFDVLETANITYQLEAGGFALTLPAPNTQDFAPGSYTFTYQLEIRESGTGWARLHVTSPTDLFSNEVTFTLTCTP